ncbi:MAG TPA: hypothetical protein VMK65_10200 [Longimicrobiales bacterium]|nr:hypothetical protein [Longimicrobiales bacterium]
MMNVRHLSAALLAIVLGTTAAAAQTVPFGKNKIQYRDFDWQVLSGEHVDVYYYPEEETLARLTLAYAEESYRFLEEKFQHHPFRRIPLIVYASDKDFEQTNIFPGFIPEGVLGFTEYLKRRVALPFRGDYDQFRQTLRHELVHAFQLSKLSETMALHPRIRRPAPQQFHAWTEGLAEFWSSEQSSEDDMFIRDLVLNGRTPDIRSFLYSYTFASYPLGGELHGFLTGRFGEDYIVRVYEDYWKYDSFEQTLEGVLGADLEKLSREWKYELEQRFFPLYADRPPFDVGSEPLITEGGANFNPSIYVAPGDTSPGLLFMSPRTGYTNLYRTTLARGERGVKTVLEGERTAEFESFHAGDSRIDVNGAGVVALVSKYNDRDALFLWDLQREKVVGRYQWPDLVALRSPSWHPDRGRVVFEGLSTAGFSDLYILDFATQERSALTADRYKDEDPDWSPDGRHIVFSSDRTAFGQGGYRNLFLYDVEEGEIDYLTYGRWKDRDPRWSNDGDRVAFSSDRSGIFDLYWVDLAGNGKRLTAMTGGAQDPDWLPDDSGLVFAGYSKGQLLLYRKDFGPDTLDQPAVALTDGIEAGHGVALAALEEPPPNGEEPGREDGRLAALGDDPLPMGWEWTDLDAEVLDTADVRDYSTLGSFTLDFAGGDAVVAPGLGAAQGAQFLATDMLGDHILFAGVSAVQAEDLGRLIDHFSGNVLYLNLAHRLNFGGGLFRFKGQFYDVALDVYEEETYGGYFLASYPFSKFRRLELQLGVEKSDRRDIPDAFEAGLFGRSTREDPRDLTREGLLTTNYLSYVKDNTLWLPTGPIDGERFNVTVGLVTCFACTTPSELTHQDVTRSAAAENYVVTADYRRYIRTTLRSALALRAYGFYSDGAIPGRSVLGGPHRLRGYPRFSLAGSRVWLANSEWRFPILHGMALAFPFGELRLPGLQGALFGDLGSSWLEGQDPTGSWGSYGISLRTSLGAPLVLRWDIGKRWRLGDRPPVLFDPGEEFGDTFVDFFFGYNF